MCHELVANHNTIKLTPEIEYIKAMFTRYQSQMVSILGLGFKSSRVTNESEKITLFRLKVNLQSPIFTDTISGLEKSSVLERFSLYRKSR